LGELALAVVAVESVFFRKLNLLLRHYQESEFIDKGRVGELLSLALKHFYKIGPGWSEWAVALVKNFPLSNHLFYQVKRLKKMFFKVENEVNAFNFSVIIDLLPKVSFKSRFF